MNENGQTDTTNHIIFTDNGVGKSNSGMSAALNRETAYPEIVARMWRVLYADGLQIGLIDELWKADANDESNCENDEATQDDSDSEDPLGHGLTDEHRRARTCQARSQLTRRACVRYSVCFFALVHILAIA